MKATIIKNDHGINFLVLDSEIINESHITDIENSFWIVQNNSLVIEAIPENIVLGYN